MPTKSVYKGYFVPANPKKYIGELRDIVFRSLWERQMMKFLDSHQSIVKWSSETIFVSYYSPLVGGMRKYFPDFYVEAKETDGSIKKYLIEVKPYEETQPPKQPKCYRSKKYCDKLQVYIVNQAKWQAAEQFAKSNGMSFQILTEKEIFGKMGVPKPEKLKK